MSGNGMFFNKSVDKSIGEIVVEVSAKVLLLIRQEVELAKAEVIGKISKLAMGAVVAVAVGVFLVFGVTMFFYFLVWFINDLGNWGSLVWLGYGIVVFFLFIFVALVGLLVYCFFKKGSLFVLAMAIEQVKLMCVEFEAQIIQRDQVGRMFEKGEELKK